MGVIIRCKLAMHNEKNVKIAMCQFVTNVISYVTAKYWFTAGKVIAKKGELTFETQCRSTHGCLAK